MKTDFMTTVADKLKPMLVGVKASVKQRVFLGAGVTQLSPTEALNRLRTMSPEARAALIQQVGPDEFMSQLESLLEEASNANSRS